MKTKKDLAKREHGAGGYTLYVTNEKGNTRFGDAKKKAIIQAIEDSWTEGVYQTATGKIKRQLLNGNAQFLLFDRETGEYFFS